MGSLRAIHEAICSELALPDLEVRENCSGSGSGMVFGSAQFCQVDCGRKTWLVGLVKVDGLKTSSEPREFLEAGGGIRDREDCLFFAVAWSSGSISQMKLNLLIKSFLAFNMLIYTYIYI